MFSAECIMHFVFSDFSCVTNHNVVGRTRKLKQPMQTNDPTELFYLAWS